ncbi:vesicular glutamate transporter 2-like [Physella acuta]|uniref:vesicular glutamate transporter 2-like n=1 Tax=Physella acuta TaxID=109671 RepID=UPI0027DB5A40|nr:vesicular glutamate transporter 2-like [Physella acuta]
MAFCFPYRYLVVGLASLGFMILVSMRTAFVLVLTHTSRANVSEVTGFFPGCTRTNASSGYISSFDLSSSMQFHTVYFLGMFISLVFCGYFASRFPAPRIMGTGTFISSVLFMILPVVFENSKSGVMVIRFLQGLIEGLGQPAIAVLITSWALKHERSLMFSVGFLGLYLGPAVGNVISGVLMCYVSWHSPMYACGVIGVIWALVWSFVAYPLPQECPFLGKDEALRYIKEGEIIFKGSKEVAETTPWKEILTSKPVWAIWVASFCKSFVFSCILAVHPMFFKEVFGILAADIGLVMSLAYVLNSIFICVCSFIADRLIASRLFSVTSIRKFMQCFGVGAEAVFFICMIYSKTYVTSVFFMASAYVIGGMTFAGYSCNIVDLSPQFSGPVSAVAISGIVGSVLSTLFASFLAGERNSVSYWAPLFWAEVGVSAATAVFYFLFASGEKQPWGSGADDETATDICIFKRDRERRREKQLLLDAKVMLITSSKEGDFASGHWLMSI